MDKKQFMNNVVTDAKQDTAAAPSSKPTVTPIVLAPTVPRSTTTTVDLAAGDYVAPAAQMALTDEVTAPEPSAGPLYSNRFWFALAVGLVASFVLRRIF